MGDDVIHKEALFNQERIERLTEHYHELDKSVTLIESTLSSIEKTCNATLDETKHVKAEVNKIKQKLLEEDIKKRFKQNFFSGIFKHWRLIGIAAVSIFSAYEWFIHFKVK